MGAAWGGYGAAAWAGPLGLGCVALAPQFSIDQRVVPFEPRWQDDAAHIRFDNSLIGKEPQATGFVFFDSAHPLEKQHAALIAEHSDCQLVPCPYGGHAIAHYINMGYGLQRLVSEILGDTFSTEEFMRYQRAHRRSHPVYAAQLISHLLRRKKHDTAKTILNRLVDLDTFPFSELNEICCSFVRYGDLEIARMILGKMEQHSFTRAFEAVQLARISKHLLDQENYSELIKNLAQQFPGNTFLSELATQ